MSERRGSGDSVLCHRFVILTNKKGLEALIIRCGGGRLPEISGLYHQRDLVICGDAACVWDDLEAYGCKSGNGVAKDGHDFMMVNRIGATFPGNIEHWYSNAAHLIRAFMNARRQEYEYCVPRHTHSCQEGAAWRWPWNGVGTSGLGATLTGIGLGYKHIVLCGLPLDDGPHNGEPHWRRTKFTTEAKDSHWKLTIEHCGDRIRSMSGRTRDWFGGP